MSTPLPTSGGRYEEEIQWLAEHTECIWAILMVGDGKNGDGFSVASKDPEVLKHIPNYLRQVAKAIEDKNYELVDGRRPDDLSHSE